MNYSINQLVDTGTYPLHDPHNLQNLQVLKKCRYQLAETGCCVLPHFLNPSILHKLIAEVSNLQSFHRSSSQSAYHGKQGKGLHPPNGPQDVNPTHPYHRKFPQKLRAVANDCIPSCSLLRQLYESSELKSFLGVLLQQQGINIHPTPLHEFADNFQSLNVMYMEEGDELAWHYDSSDTVVTLMLQPPIGGGRFVFAPFIRGNGAIDEHTQQCEDERFDAVQALFDGNVDTTELAVEAGDLVVFNGQRSLHRVTPVVGSRKRIIAVLSYSTLPREAQLARGLPSLAANIANYGSRMVQAYAERKKQNQDVTATTKTVQLSSGFHMPLMAFGLGTTWKDNKEHHPEKLGECVRHALDIGFRHLDEAEMYGTETSCGVAIRQWLDSRRPDSELLHLLPNRTDLFVTSKILSSVSKIGVRAGCLQSLKRLGLDYLDLYLIHAPFPNKLNALLEDVWREMEGLVASGLVKSIGVSNFTIRHLERVLKVAKINPAVNQVECHAYLQQEQLSAFCQEHGIVVCSYSGLSPMTHSKCKGGPIDTIVASLAIKYNKTTSQILQRWLLQDKKGIVTTTTKLKRVALALDIFQFQLSPSEMHALRSAGRTRPYRVWWRSELGEFELGELGKEEELDDVVKSKSIASLINVARYPIDQPQSQDYIDLVQQCRDQLKRTGNCSLAHFLTKSVLRKAMAEVNQVVESTSTQSLPRWSTLRTPYLADDNSEFPAGHPRAALFPQRFRYLTADRVPTKSVVSRLFHSNALTRFVSDVLEKKPLYRSACPTLSVQINLMSEGDVFPWHFDQNDGVVLLLLQRADHGGMFQYVPNIRHGGSGRTDDVAQKDVEKDVENDGENYAEMKKVFDNESLLVQEPTNQTPGTFVLFKGKRSVHRVTRVGATQQPRVIALFSYDQQEGMEFPKQVQENYRFPSNAPQFGKKKGPHQAQWVVVRGRNEAEKMPDSKL